MTGTDWTRVNFTGALWYRDMAETVSANGSFYHAGKNRSYLIYPPVYYFLGQVTGKDTAQNRL